ncbi:unnamed protein product [Effrenium voratum]|uniref:NHR domain-containing protein n=1 Tax=Effrenium voratum TaxID=2562239 RepID=A0AA36MGZ5_9DINO|nr:unnamed protein product [Effrenium voratum]CAJ1412617.1 unnamed protein product [Effrenium voratum]
MAGPLPDQPLFPFVDLGRGKFAVSLEVGAEPPPPGLLGGFSRRLCSPLVTLDKLRARRTGVSAKGAGLGCVCFGDGPLPTFPEGRYFEVCVEEVAAAFADGLTLGVCAALPEDRPPEPYATCEEVPQSFCYGFDGMAHRYDWEDLTPIDWSPVNLELGDAVGVLVTPEGVLQLVVNGMLEAESLQGLPQAELFPLVELMGNTVAVSLRLGAAPPEIQRRPKPEAPEPDPPAPEIAPAPAPTPAPEAPAAPAPVAKAPAKLSAAKPAPAPVPKSTSPAFYAPLLSKQVQLSKDGNSVRHKDDSGEEVFGVCIGNSPLVPSAGGRYFEVRVDKVREGAGDGLALGFTLVPPEELAGEEPHETSDTLPESWTAGYDGFYRSMHRADERVKWDPASLQVHDRVGALLSRAGQFIILVNGKVVARVSDDFPLADVEAFYAVVDLLGRVCQVTMVRDAQPPAVATEGAVFSGFDPKLVGQAVGLDGPRLLATSRDPVGNALGGVLFGDGPLPCTGPDGEAYFEVVVEEVRQGNDDGLVLGVASQRPRAMEGILMACDVKEAWSIGYNGCAFCPDLEDELPVKWSPVGLKQGDRAGLLIKGDGTLVVLVNGQPVCKGPKQAPVLDVPLYPVVDLLGNCKAARLTAPSPELVRQAVLNCAKVVKRSLLSNSSGKSQRGGDPAFFDAW